MTKPDALYTVAEIRAIEHAAYRVLAPGTLMERAGQAACDAAMGLLPDVGRTAPVLVLAGPGNNGGDALDTAARLARRGMRVTVLLHANPAKQASDAQQALERARNSTAVFADSTFHIGSERWALVIDGLFGIGLRRPITEPLRTLVQQVNGLSCPRLALDVPSGLDADTGAIVGPDGIAVKATHTITFIADKPGLHTAHGRDHAGGVLVASLDIDQGLFPQAQARLNQPSLFARMLQPRPHNSHKGSYGDVAVIGGAPGMAGAPVLAARAALKCGAGRTLIGFLDQPPSYDIMQPELMCRSAAAIRMDSTTLVVGPGLGTSDTSSSLLRAALTAPSPLVLDADGLNLLAGDAVLAQQLASRTPAALLTPHPLEAARLLKSSASVVQADRPAAARQLAQQLNAIVILKGSGSIIARPGGEIVINATGNPGLATAGSGDVLAGICGALLAQHWPTWEAALAAVWLHGVAADMLAAEHVGPVGLTAGELIPQVRALLNRLIAENAANPGAC